MDELAAKNLVAYLGDQREVTGVLPTDRTIVVERFRDELGDWRVVMLTPFGGRVHAPWSMAIEARLREQHGIEVQSIWSDDGIAVRLPEGVESDGSTIEGALLFEPDEIEERLTADLGGSALFAARFRENAARALLLPRRRPGQRTPLWMQRQRSADLLAVASQYGSFPIILETYREVLRDVFDMPALREVLADIRARRIRMVSVESRSASPFASSLLFDYIGSFMYEGDAPLAERRAQALALDRELLAELLGSEELRELIDPAAVADLELELQALAPNRQARTIDGVADLLRRLGDLRAEEVAARVSGLDATDALGELEATRRAIRIRVAGEERWIAVEDAARYRDAVGASPPPGVAETFLAPVDRPLDLLLARWARTHAPFTADDPAGRWGVARAVVEERLRAMATAGDLLEGAFRPGGTAHEFTDPDVLRQLRRRSLARLRREVEPVEHEVLARFLPAWHGVGSSAGGLGRLIEAVTQLEGVPLPASVLERDVLPARVAGYTPRLLDELGAAGEVVWIGRGSLGRDDGRVALFRRDRVDLLAAAGSADDRPSGPIHDAIRQHLQRRGASFFPQLRAAGADARNDDELLDALWDLVWAGEVTNDTFAPLRALSLPRSRSRRSPRPGRVLALGPPNAAGRWSLVADLVGEERSPTERGHALATTLLERHGVVTREAVVAEGIAGGYASVYPVLRAMEESGRARRGYFVAGLGAAQFALPGAVDRLRAIRDDEPTERLMAATDPAQPYGAALPWPRGSDDERLPLQRAAGAYVAIVDGHAVLYVERGGRSLLRLPAASRRLAPRARGRDAAVAGRDRWTDARAPDRACRPRAGVVVGPGPCTDGRRVPAELPGVHAPRLSASGAVDGLGFFEDHLGAAAEHKLLHLELGLAARILAARLRSRVVEMRADLDPGPAIRHRCVRRRVDRDLHADSEELLGVIGEDQVVIDVLAQEPPARLLLEGAGAPEPGIVGDLRPPAAERDRLRAEAGETLESRPPEGEVLRRVRLLRAGDVLLREPWLAGLARRRDPAEPDRAVVRIGLGFPGAAACPAAGRVPRRDTSGSRPRPSVRRQRRRATRPRAIRGARCRAREPRAPSGPRRSSPRPSRRQGPAAPVGRRRPSPRRSRSGWCPPRLSCWPRRSRSAKATGSRKPRPFRRRG